MTISLAIKLNGGAAGAPLSIAAGGAITATLDSIDGVRTVTWSIASADDLSAPGDYTLVTSGIVDETCNFNALATLGTSAILQAVANGDPTIYARVKFFVPSANSLETGADDEKFEGDTTHGTARLMNEAIRAAGTTAGVTATPPLASSGGLTPDISLTPGTAGQIIVTNAGATAGAWVSVSGDASLASTGALTVSKVNGTSVNAGGALSAGQVLRATGASSAVWGAVDLADTDAVTGVLPKANQASQDMAGDVTGTTAASVVAKINGTTVNAGGALSAGQVLRATGASAAQWGAVDLADGDAVTGLLPLANLTPGTNGQAFITNAGGTAGAWVTVSGDATITAAGAVTVAKANGASVPAAGALTTGNVLQVSGASALSYSAVNLAGGVGYVTGVLPIANVDATATPTASKIPLWGASVDLGAAFFYGGGTVATTGVLRAANNVTGAAARNSGGSGDLAVWKYDGSDILQLGDVNAAGVVFNAKGTGANAVKVLLDGATTPTRLSATAAGVGLFVAPDAGSGVDVLTIGVANTAPTAAPGSGKINAWGNSTTHALQVENADGVVTDAAPGVDTFESPTIFQVVDRLFFKKTTDGTTFHVAELTIPNQGIATLYVDCHVHKDGTDLAAYYSFIVRARLTGASVSVDDTPTIVADKDNIGAGQTIAGSTTATTLRVDIAGAAANNLTWSGRVHGIITKK